MIYVFNKWLFILENIAGFTAHEQFHMESYSKYFSICAAPIKASFFS